MSYAKQFALLGAVLGLIAPAGLFAYALVRGGQPDPLLVFLVMAGGGVLCLGGAGLMIGRREDALAESNAKLKALSELLAQQSITDPLTGVANRRAFDAELAKEAARCERYRTLFSLVMLDLDHFKRLNDTYGHVAGDDVLRFVAGTLDQQKRRGDSVARYGGEEFSVILPHTTLKDASRWAERTRLAICLASADTAAGPLTVTASFGVATFVPGQMTAAQLVLAADKALYGAKAAGRNCVQPPPHSAASEIPPS